MSKINMGRVLLGGLAAGVVLDASDGILNSVVLADQWTAYMQSVGKAPAFGGSQIAGFVINGFVLSIALLWLYAAIRPRFGPGLHCRRTGSGQDHCGSDRSGNF